MYAIDIKADEKVMEAVELSGIEKVGNIFIAKNLNELIESIDAAKSCGGSIYFLNAFRVEDYSVIV